MHKKEQVTRKELEQDLISALKQPADMPKSTHQKWIIPAVIFAILFVVLEFVSPLLLMRLLMWFLLALLAFLPIVAVVEHVQLKYKIKKLSLDDYEIKTATVSHTDSETYVVKKGRWHSERINNYNIWFEDLGVWHIPKRIHFWSERLEMSDCAVYHKAHRGDTFVVVISKKTGMITLAYNTALFEWRV